MFWAANGDFGSLLTGQLFIEDMESYAMVSRGWVDEWMNS